MTIGTNNMTSPIRFPMLVDGFGLGLVGPGQDAGSVKFDRSIGFCGSLDSVPVT